MSYRPRRGEYGFDAPYVPLGFAVVAIGFTVWALPSLYADEGTTARARLLGALVLAVQAISFLYTTRRGKFVVWSAILDSIRWRGNERVLDLGCGRGAVLTLVAERLTQGRATGVDIWRRGDQSGNSSRACRQNIVREGVGARVALTTADMRALPFVRSSFDVIVSSLAIHNIGDASGRARALAHAVRVLAPGGRLLVADIKNARVYASELRRLGMLDVRVHGLGWRFWYGSPFAATSLVTARKAGPTPEDSEE